MGFLMKNVLCSSTRTVFSGIFKKNNFVFFSDLRVQNIIHTLYRRTQKGTVVKGALIPVHPNSYPDNKRDCLQDILRYILGP